MLVDKLFNIFDVLPINADRRIAMAYQTVNLGLVGIYF